MSRRFTSRPAAGPFTPETRLVLTPLGRAALAARRRPDERHPLMVVPADPVRRVAELERERLALLGVVEELDAEVGRLWARLVAAGLEAE